MAARSLAELVLQDAAGSVRPGKSLVFYEVDGVTPLAQSVYTVVSGGSPDLSPAVNSLGTARYYTPNPQRAMVAASDFPTTKVPIVFEPDPADLLLNGMSTVLLLAGGLSVTRDSSTLYALTAQQLNATNERIFQALDPNGLQALYIDENTTRIPSGKKLSVGNQNATANSNAAFCDANANEFWVNTDMQYINSYVGIGTPDVSTLRVFAQQAAGDAYNRALEVHTLANFGTSTWPKLGIELTMQANHLGNNADRTVGMSIKNLGDVWGLSAPKRIDTFLLLGGDQYGAVNGILYQDTIGAGAGTLFKVSQAGVVTSKGMLPVTTDVQDLGALATRWNVGYINFTVQGDGAFNGPSITFLNETTSGFYRAGAGAVGAAILGAEVGRFIATGIRSEADLIGKHGTVASPASGYSALRASAANTWVTKDSSGNTATVMTSSSIGRKNRLINGDMRIKQRTVMPTADNAYALDGMRVVTEAGSTGYVVSQETSDLPTSGSRGAVKLAVGSSNNLKSGLFLPITGQDMWDLRGGVASVQFALKVSNARIGDVRVALLQWTSTEDAISADPIANWGTGAATNPTYTTWTAINTPANISPTTSWATYKLENQAISSSATNLAVFIWNNDFTTTAGDYMLVSDVQLEPGAFCTAVERRSYASQLLDCQHWLQAFGGVNAQVAFVSLGGNSSTTLAEFGPIMRRPMRAAPTLVKTLADWQVYENAAGVDFTDLSILYVTPSEIWLRGTVASGLTAGRAVALAPKAAGSYAQLLLTAEP